MICFLKEVGVECPGCGFLHSLFYLVQGDLLMSLRAHPLGVIAVGWSFYLFLVFLRKRSANKLAVKYFSNFFIWALFINWGIKLMFVVSA